MSTPSTTLSHTPLTIPFTIAQPQQNLRLLELPPELLDLLSSRDPQTLYLKSSSTSSSTAPDTRNGSGTASASEFLHFCSPTQSYLVRQVSSSNTLFVTQPWVKDGEREREVGDKDEHTEEEKGERSSTHDSPATSNAISICAIAQVSSVLELHPVEIDAEGLLRGLLPVWKGVDDYDDGGRDDERRRCRWSSSKRDIFAEIPAPNTAIETAWRRIFAIEVRGECYAPDPTALLEAWRKIMELCTFRGWGPAGLLQIREWGVPDLEPELEPELEPDFDNGYVVEAQGAIIHAICSSPGLFPLQQSPPREGGVVEVRDGDQIPDLKALMVLVGELLLQVQTQTQDGLKLNTHVSVPITEFMTAWRDLVYEELRPKIQLDLLTRGSYQITSSSSSDQRVGTGVGGGGGGGGGRANNNTTVAGSVAVEDKHKHPQDSMNMNRSSKEEAKTTTGVGKNRKWHDKFKDSRGTGMK